MFSSRDLPVSASSILRFQMCTTTQALGIKLYVSYLQGSTLLTEPSIQPLFIYLFIKIYFIYIGCVTVCLRVCMCTMCRPGVCRGQKRVLDLLELEFINLGTKFKFSGRAENAPRHCAFSVLCSCHTIILIYF